MLKSTISQHVKRMETKDVLQWVEVDATPPLLLGSISVRISPDVTLGGDHVAAFDAEHFEDIDEEVKLFAVTGTKMNP